MAEDYALLEGRRQGGVFTKAVGVGSLIALIVAVIIGIVISTQVAKLPRAVKTSDGVDVPTVNPNWQASCDAFKNLASNTVTAAATQQVLIKNATVWTGLGQTLQGYDLLIGTNGKISQVARNINSQGVPRVIQADGAWVTPGLVDMHSHAGVYSFPGDAQATQDGNEMTNPTFPAVRAIDAFDPEDPAIPWIVAGGVTASQILPGSGNVMGGQALAVKLFGSTVSEMAIPNAPVALKFACGENPKNTYGSRRQTPMSRMGIGYEMRLALGKAHELLLKKEDYCRSPQSGLMPTDLLWENLVALLQKRAVLNIHCYKVVDFEMAMRVADEFNVPIAAFHHAIEAYRIPKPLAERNIAVALFSDIRGYKFEAYKDSVYGPRLLNAQGVDVIFKTDHPVIFGWELLSQAQKAAHWGLPAEAALQAVTSKPARTAGFTNFGALTAGSDADIVVWDRHPLRWGARPKQVFINGNDAFQADVPVRHDQLTYTSPFQTWKMTTTPATVCATAASNEDSLASYAVTNALLMIGTQGIPSISNGVLVVTDGNVSCVGTAASCPIPGSYPRLDMQGGVVTPGFVMAGLPLGSVEVDQESNWQDGNIVGGHSVSTLGGIQLQTTHTRDAWADGILTAVARPMGARVDLGSASSFNMGPSINLLTDADGHSYIVKEFTSIDLQVSNGAKAAVPSISDQIAFIKNIKWTEGAWVNVANGNMPLVFWVNSADYMLAILRALEAGGLSPANGVKLIFGGAAEAHLVAKQLKEWNASVIYRRCGPDGYETRRCNNDLALETLKTVGIPVGLAQTVDGDMSKIRGLRWNAGLLLDQGYTAEEALATVTSNLATMYQLPDGIGALTVDTPANWVAFNGNPLDTTSIIEALGVHGKIICKPEQV
jgi:imidazolonepropionase-like amidohydrolase